MAQISFFVQFPKSISHLTKDLGTNVQCVMCWKYAFNWKFCNLLE